MLPTEEAERHNRALAESIVIRPSVESMVVIDLELGALLTAVPFGETRDGSSWSCLERLEV